MIQTSCSELLVDTAIHDPKVALKRFKEIFTTEGIETSPPLSLEVLIKLKEANERNDRDGDVPEILVYNKYGDRAWLEYGDNGYIHTGFRFDSHCNQGDELCFPIFAMAIRKLKGKMEACDGGSTSGYEEWQDAIASNKPIH